MGDKIPPGPQPKRTDNQPTRVASEDELGFGFESEDTVTDLTNRDPLYGESYHSPVAETLVGAEYEKDETYWNSVKEEIMDGLCQMMYKKTKAELGMDKFNFINNHLAELAIPSLSIFKDIEKFYGGMERPKDHDTYYIGVAPETKKLVLEDITVDGVPARVVVEVAYGKRHADLFCRGVRVEK